MVAMEKTMTIAGICLSLIVFCQGTEKNLPVRTHSSSHMTISRRMPWTAEINGGSIVYYSASHEIGGGYITGSANEVITVTVSASGPPGGTFSMECEISGAFFSDGSTTVTATNGSASKQFTCPSGGSVYFDGIFSESTQSGGGNISVQ